MRWLGKGGKKEYTVYIYARPFLEKSRYRAGRRGNVIGNAGAWIDQSFSRRTLEFHVHASFVSRFLLLIVVRPSESTNRQTPLSLSLSLSLLLDNFGFTWGERYGPA